MDMAAARLGIDPAEIRRRNLIRPEQMPYDCGTKSFGVTTVYDSGDFPALFGELLRRLDYDRVRAEQRSINRGAGPAPWRRAGRLRREDGARPLRDHARRGAPRRTLHGGHRRLVDGTRAWRRCSPRSSATPSSFRPTRFDVRHADTATVESGVGTYGSRGTVTAGNAAHQAGGQADRRGPFPRGGDVEDGRRRHRLRGGSPLGEWPSRQPGRAGGEPEAGGGDVVQRDEADLRRLRGGRGAGRRSRHRERLRCGGSWWAPTWAGPSIPP